DERVVGRARQILGSDVYVHQSRINVKPGFGASGFYWHSDFETWHAEDGLPNMRTVSVSIALTENFDTNGGLMIMPGSHKTFLGCAGETPKDNYKKSLQMQDAGTPSDEALTAMADRHGIKLFTGKPGSG
ncbi:phytanoyl-CoA dioxygenase family protein, partial [Streptomyces exfoliatus]